MDFIKKNKYKIVLLVLAILFFCLYNYLNFSHQNIFNSPDETANFVLSKSFVETNKISYTLQNNFDKLNEFIHPRSTFVFGNNILPVSFITFIIVSGFVGKIFGTGIIVYLNSIFLILAVLAFFGINKKIFDEKVSFLSSVLFFMLPAVWYYLERSMFHNITFVSLVIIGLWFILCQPFRKQIWLSDLLGMSIFMLGVFMRPNEMTWIGLVFLFTIIYFKKQIKISRLIMWSSVAVFFVLMYVFANFYFYGSVSTGYVASNSLQVHKWYSLLFPFGFDFLMTIKSVWNYFFKMNILFGVSAFLSGIFFVYLFLKNKLNKVQKVYFVSLLVSSLFLFFYYGSNHDNLYNLKTVAVAYVRYWLPIFIGFLPIIVFFIIEVLKKIKNNLGKNLLYFVYIVVFFFLSFNIVYKGIDGVLAVDNQLKYMTEIKNWVVDNTSQDAIIVTDHEDKYFWPQRQIVVDFYNDSIGQTIPALLEKNAEMYYFVPKQTEEDYTKMLVYLAKFAVDVDVFQRFNSHTLYKLNLP